MELPAPVCKNCSKLIVQDGNSDWVHIVTKGTGHRKVEYLDYLCGGRDNKLYSHEPMDFLEQLGVYDLWDIEASLR